MSVKAASKTHAILCEKLDKYINLMKTQGREISTLHLTKAQLKTLNTQANRGLKKKDKIEVSDYRGYSLEIAE